MRWQQNVHNPNFVEFLLQLKNNCYLKIVAIGILVQFLIYLGKIVNDLGQSDNKITFLSTEIVSLSRMSNSFCPHSYFYKFCDVYLTKTIKTWTTLRMTNVSTFQQFWSSYNAPISGFIFLKNLIFIISGLAAIVCRLA